VTPAPLPDPATELELLRRSFDQSTDVIGAVGPDQWHCPTPCPAFDVETLVGHMLFAAKRLATVGRREAAAEDGPAVVGLAAGEWASALTKTADEAIDVWRSPGATAGDIVLPFGTFAAPVVLGMYVLEQTTHAWDLAVAVGATDHLDSELAAAVVPIAQAIVVPEYRGPEPMPFAAEVAAADDAPAYDRLAAFMGRRPSWTTTDAAQRADLLSALAKQRTFLRHTASGLGDAEARRRSTVSALCIAGIVKHVTAVERRWARFIAEAAPAMAMNKGSAAAHTATFEITEAETLKSLLSDYEAAARETETLVGSLESLDDGHPLPRAPWFDPGSSWSHRRVLLHLLMETAQHAGHADIVREAIDGSRTMG